MTTDTVPQVTAQQAQAVANLFLSDHLPDRFIASDAQFDSADERWHVTVILAYPVLGSIGDVGEILISTEAAEMVSHTAIEQMKQAAVKLYQARRSDIETAFS